MTNLNLKHTVIYAAHINTRHLQCLTRAHIDQDTDSSVTARSRPLIYSDSVLSAPRTRSSPRLMMTAGDSDDDQLRELTYRKLSVLDYTLDEAELTTQCPLDNGRHTVQPRHLVGQLDSLPGELLDEILVSLDLQTLTTFRLVNNRAMSLVDSLHQYVTVLKHCPDVIRAVISIHAESFSCQTLYDTLSTSRCHTCKSFGAYLYLITCRRVCYFCFTKHLDYFPVSAAQVNQYTSPERGQLETLPRVLSLMGRYTGERKFLRSRIQLYDRNAVLSRASEAEAQALDEATRQRDLMAKESRRHVAIISAPWIISSRRAADWGFYCAVCRDSKEPATHFKEKLTRDDMLHHIRWHSTRDIA